MCNMYWIKFKNFFQFYNNLNLENISNIYLLGIYLDLCRNNYLINAICYLNVKNNK